MAVQPGFFDIEVRLSGLSRKGDELERLAAVVDFELFRPELERAVPRADRSKGGRPPFDHVLMFKVLVLQTQNNRKRPTNQAPADCEWRDAGDGSDAAGGSRGGFSRARRRVRGTDARPRGARPR